MLDKIQGRFEMSKGMAGRPGSENQERHIGMIPNLRVLRDYNKYPGPQLVTFGYNVAGKLDIVLFPNLPVLPKDLETLVDTLSAKLADTIMGGPTETAAKKKAQEAVCEALNLDANIVEVVAKHDLETLLKSGYLPVSTNRSSSPLDAPGITGLENYGSTKVLLRLTPVANACSYHVQVSADGGKTWLEAGISRQARRIVLNNLTPGTNYLVRARAIGGSTGASDWSGTSSIMST
jgi:hypothetical protein